MFREEVTLVDAVMTVVLMESSVESTALLGVSSPLHTTFCDDPDAQCMLCRWNSCLTRSLTCSLTCSRNQTSTSSTAYCVAWISTISRLACHKVGRHHRRHRSLLRRLSSLDSVRRLTSRTTMTTSCSTTSSTRASRKMTPTTSSSHRPTSCSRKQPAPRLRSTPQHLLAPALAPMTSTCLPLRSPLPLLLLLRRRLGLHSRHDHQRHRRLNSNPASTLLSSSNTISTLRHSAARPTHRPTLFRPRSPAAGRHSKAPNSVRTCLPRFRRHLSIPSIWAAISRSRFASTSSSNTTNSNNSNSSDNMRLQRRLPIPTSTSSGRKSCSTPQIVRESPPLPSVLGRHELRGRCVCTFNRAGSIPTTTSFPSSTASQLRRATPPTSARTRTPSRAASRATPPPSANARSPTLCRQQRRPRC